MIKNYIWLILMVFGVFGCKKQTEDFQITGKEYINEAIGRVRTYKVDSIYFSDRADFGKDTTISFYQRHITKNIFKDSTGKDYFYHQVFNSFNQIDWFPVMAYKTYVDSTTFIKQENNKKVIHLTLPIRTSTVWDGNLLNDERGVSKFRYVEVDDLMTPDSIYKDQITVRLKKDILPITESFAHFESYAPNKGMVYKYIFYREIQQNTNNILAESGFHLHYNLIDYQ